MNKNFRDALTQAQVNRVNIFAVLIPAAFFLGYLFNRELKYDEEKARYKEKMMKVYEEEARVRFRERETAEAKQSSSSANTPSRS